MTFDGRRALKEDNLRWKMTFNRVTATAQLTPNRKPYQLSKAEIDLDMMKEMYAASCMRMCAEKTTFLGKYDSSIHQLLYIMHHISCMFVMHHA